MCVLAQSISQVLVVVVGPHRSSHSVPSVSHDEAVAVITSLLSLLSHDDIKLSGGSCCSSPSPPGPGRPRPRSVYIYDKMIKLILDHINVEILVLPHCTKPFKICILSICLEPVHHLLKLLQVSD